MSTAVSPQSAGRGAGLAILLAILGAIGSALLLLWAVREPLFVAAFVA